MKTKATDAAVRRMWAVIASSAAKTAVTAASNERFEDAAVAMIYIEEWLNKAGARATDWNFRTPSA